MNRSLSLLVLSTIVLLSPSFALADNTGKASYQIEISPTDWPWWRGPQRNGVAASGQKLPHKWSENENVLWKAPVPGRGHGSPIIVGDRIFLPTADLETETQSLLCFDRKTGKKLWETEIHKGGFVKANLNAKSSHASASAACDGQRVYINFLIQNAIHTTALDLTGKILWQKKITDYVLHQGFGSSPAIYQNLLLVSADNKGGAGAIVALDRVTGETVWKVSRPKFPNYASPVVLNVAGRDQLFFIGCELVTSLDPLKGDKIWEIPGATTECVTSTVTDGQHIYTSGGFPKQHVAAIKADGSGKVAWEAKTRVYVPSMVIREGHLYGVQDAGVAHCWKSDTGEELWKNRLEGAFTASPVLVDDLLFGANEVGVTYIWKASPKAFELIAENKLGDEVMATPTICGNRLYFRVAHKAKGQRQEMLYCIGQ